MKNWKKSQLNQKELDCHASPGVTSSLWASCPAVIQIFARLLMLQPLGFPAVQRFKLKRQRLQTEEGKGREGKSELDPSKDKYRLVETQMAVSLSQLIAPEQMSWWSLFNDGQTSNLQTPCPKTTAAVEHPSSVCWTGRAHRDRTHAQALSILGEGQRRPVLFW